MYDLNHLYNLDCMEAMQQIPDGYFQLAIVDPPMASARTAKGTRHAGGWQRRRHTRHISGMIKTRRRLNTSQNCGGFPTIKLYSAQTILSAGYRLIVRAGLYGTRKTAEPILQTVNWHGPASKAL